MVCFLYCYLLNTVLCVCVLQMAYILHILFIHRTYEVIYIKNNSNFLLLCVCMCVCADIVDAAAVAVLVVVIIVAGTLLLFVKILYC